MRISTKRILSTIFLVTVISFTVNAQTNVSGGIFSNTTWTLAGSPYIVIDTTVVFPGVTLTIEPGVVVKFDDNMYLEIRQATLISMGTATDSITFTSNSSSPSRGIWGHANNGGIWLNGNPTPIAFNFCNIKYATRSIGGVNIQYLKNSSFTNNEYGFYNISFPVDSCVFKNNNTGINDLTNTTLNYCTISNNNFGVEDSHTDVVLNNCTINSNSLGVGGNTGETADTKFYNCRISHNGGGVYAHSAAGNVFRDCIINYNSLVGIVSSPIVGIDSIINCEIKFNATGVTAQSAGCVITQCEFEYDTMGIVIRNSSANIYCNKICNNISYGLKMEVSSNFNVSDNYWCTTDSSQIAAAIYDGYDNVAVGLVTFFPLDSVCYVATGIQDYETQPLSFNIFPNPAADEITIELPSNSSKAEIKIFNMPGELVYSSRLTKQKTTIDISAFMKGAYIIQIATADTISRQKLIRQ